MNGEILQINSKDHNIMYTKDELVERISQIKQAIATTCILHEDIFFTRCLIKTLNNLENQLETL